MTRVFSMITILTLFSPLALALTPTPSLMATFTSTVEAGTCDAQIQDATGKVTSNIDFGDIYKSDLANKNSVQDFNIVLTNCAGTQSANITTEITSGCAADSFPNDGGTSLNAEVEIWKGEPDTGTQFSCKNSSTTSQSLDLSSKSGNMTMSARMIIAPGKTLDDVTAGNFTSPVTFVITYQ